MTYIPDWTEDKVTRNHLGVASLFCTCCGVQIDASGVCEDCSYNISREEEDDDDISL